MAKRFTAEAVKREQERRRRRRLESKWPILVAALRLDEDLQERVKLAAKRNHRKLHEEAHAALRWYYLEMWGDHD